MGPSPFREAAPGGARVGPTYCRGPVMSGRCSNSSLTRVCSSDSWQDRSILPRSSEPGMELMALTTTAQIWSRRGAVRSSVRAAVVTTRNRTLRTLREALT